ncbi:hypothetical protein [Flavobacterium sp.]|uniref:hypothetical protein n=1 Tax=Flavobacterium sp. TaxID=239 RepID=UPI0026268EE9|nr:hypothetical protein [Flavobacterium sp.]
MKYSITLIFSLLSICCFSQYPILKDSLKKHGIYRTFEEFRDNKPSIILDFKVYKHDRKLSALLNSEKFAAYGVDIDIKVGENVGEVYGFCDGKDIYLTRNLPIFMHYVDFFKVEILDRYCVFDYTVGKLSSLISYNEMPKFTRILNLENGESFKLTKKKLKEIISDNIYLSNKFELEKDKDKNLKEYLIEYLKN